MIKRFASSLINTLIRRLVSQLFRQPKHILMGLIVIIGLGGTWYGYEVTVARPAMSFMGIPQEVGQPASDWRNHILRNEGFMLGYSEKYRNPLWVTYRVTQAQKSFGKRPEFRRDWRTLAGVTTQDYTGSGYTRGHHAPNYLIASRYGVKAQAETFLMSNISPQKASLNTKTWQRLEEVAADFFSKKYPEFWVVTGPIFDADPSQIQTLKNSGIAIPKAFYKIFIRPSEATENQDENSPYQVLAIIMPQNARTSAKLTQFVSTVDEVEALTGLDFFWQLPDTIENTLEASKNDQAWSLSSVENQKSRY
ncbi:DNA/RNA non-specific endonuclease [Thiosulfativibrio zosterae]|uniref:DNA/RNA non-specific endonuclease n=1 Tax=Thiosulfativibrio zosterae TaxID=2675053 RepID=A0A6F8PJW7_9GAMM|nr:DNA/RNA non-specific endonuclease [Thiosulfativibrio zosterae]BBP42354.1 DNA/RNA non-specific endonuclease [Thiosulfativibrio zosterae]